ncbi:MAG: hypothetical protein ABI614_12230 [Planctomycetota bacterium]
MSRTTFKDWASSSPRNRLRIAPLVVRPSNRQIASREPEELAWRYQRARDQRFSSQSIQVQSLGAAPP